MVEEVVAADAGPAGSVEAITGEVGAGKAGAGGSVIVVLDGNVGEMGEEDGAEMIERAGAACWLAFDLALVFVRFVGRN